MKKVKVGLIGCGGIANGKYLSTAPKVEEVEIIAFCDVILERAEKAAKRIGAEDALCCTDYKQLLQLEELDAVFVCTPNRSHCEITIAAF